MLIFRYVKIPEKRKEIICCPRQVQTGLHGRRGEGRGRGSLRGEGEYEGSGSEEV